MSVEIYHAGEPLSKVIGASMDLSENEMRLLDHCQMLSYESWLGYNDDKLVCAWGIIPPSLLSMEAYLWLHTTSALKENTFLFVRHAQRFVEELSKEYSIVGHVKPGAEHSKRWLKWMGAQFGPMDNHLLTFRIEKK